MCKTVPPVSPQTAPRQSSSSQPMPTFSFRPSRPKPRSPIEAPLLSRTACPFHQQSGSATSSKHVRLNHTSPSPRDCRLFPGSPPQPSNWSVCLGPRATPISSPLRHHPMSFLCSKASAGPSVSLRVTGKGLSPHLHSHFLLFCPQATSFQPCLSPHCYLDTPTMILPQGLCTGGSRYPEHSSPITSHRPMFTHHLLSESLPDCPVRIYSSSSTLAVFSLFLLYFSPEHISLSDTLCNLPL